MRSLHYIAAALLAVITCMATLPCLAAGGDDAHAFDRVREAYGSGDRNRALALSREFLKKHPQSGLVPDARMVIADCQSDPEEALKLYAVVRDKYRYYPRRDRAQYRICEIHFFLSQWKALAEESARGISLFDRGAYSDDFHYYRAVAAVQLGMLENAEEECHRMIDKSHNYSSLARALVLLSYVIRKKTGYSREYIYSLRELALGFEKADLSPSTLYLLGKFYESRHEWNRAYSAFTDIVDRFPRSPEANFSRQRLETLKEKNPRREKYLPDDKTVRETDQFDLQPEIDVTDEDTETGWYYSLSIGPFPSLRETKRIERELAEFEALKVARLRSSYTIYLGKFGTSDEALETRVRLAEEFGINATIVRVSKDSGRQYIYGE
ncbi:MAG TPA: tetratricopeptide repeat protein [Spirochaetota bacterium]|nr:tetratricopeptide repeat protein [Spirochaetota bacterium]HPI90795.1 tetratricopeptide repeat protein [Spirochaetota bacterium]HPR48939.1 tetratricopeptide repeat protein [Spirochaetota bacterium]